MPHLSIFGIIGGTVLVIMGLLMGYAVFPPMVNMKVKEVSHLENNKNLFHTLLHTYPKSFIFLQKMHRYFDKQIFIIFECHKKKNV